MSQSQFENPQSFFYSLAIALGTLLPDDITTPKAIAEGKRVIRYIRFNYLEDDIFNEVRKRTYYLAKMRSKADNAAHLLEMVAFTQDEKDIFEPYYKETSFEVYNKLIPFVRNINPSYLDRYLSGYPLLNSDFYSVVSVMTALTSLNKKIQFNGKVYTNNVASVPALVWSSGSFSSGSNGVYITSSTTSTRWYYIQPNQTAIDTDNTDLDTLLGNIDGNYDVVFIGSDGLTLNPTLFTLTTELLTDTNLILFIEQFDWFNLNSIITADNIIFESIVVGIMSKWFMMALPEEAANYIALYQSLLTQVVSTLNNSNVWKRKYRTYP